jgi:hypothetical protein
MNGPLTAELQSAAQLQYAAQHSMHTSENVLAVILPDLMHSTQFNVHCFQSKSNENSNKLYAKQGPICDCKILCCSTIYRDTVLSVQIRHFKPITSVSSTQLDLVTMAKLSDKCKESFDRIWYQPFKCVLQNNLY